MRSEPKTENSSGGKDEQKPKNTNTDTDDGGKKKINPRTGQKYNKERNERLRQEEFVVVPEPDKCSCGGALCITDSSSSFEYVMNVEFLKRMHHKKTKSCTRCGTKYRVKARPRLLGKSQFSNELATEVIAGKILDARPINRAISILKREGTKLETSVAYACFKKVGVGLKPLAELIGNDIRTNSDVIGIDETNVKVVLAGDERAAQRGVLVMLRNEKRFDGQRPPAAYFLAPQRKTSEAIKAFCEGLDAKIRVVHDGNEAHIAALVNNIDGNCWSHARRPVFETFEDSGSPESKELLELINRLFEIEEQIFGCDPDIRKMHRQKHASPAIFKIRELIDKQLPEVRKKSDYGRALAYIDARWSALTAYVDDGLLELDNNLVENAIRNFATARRVSLFAQTELGAENWSILTTILWTGVMNGLEPKAYLRFLLRTVDPRPERNDWNAVLPWNCKTEVEREPKTDPTTRYFGRVMTLAEFEAGRRARGSPELRMAAE